MLRIRTVLFTLVLDTLFCTLTSFMKYILNELIDLSWIAYSKFVDQDLCMLQLIWKYL